MNQSHPAPSGLTARLELPLARASVDRAGEIRLNPDELDRLWQSGKILHHCSGKFLVTSTSNLKFLSANEVSAAKLSGNYESGEKIFLGLDDGVGYFAWCSDAINQDAHEADFAFQTLRAVGDGLSDLEMGLAVHAQALANWHHTHLYCAKCGAMTTAGNGGTLRTCDKDASEHYPRTDPAIIVLIKDKDDRVLLGRQKVWPEHRFSCFAGFVEPGESFEHCVAREVGEEAGVNVSDVYYLGSQPWPFPASIMIAFQAITNNPEDARPDGQEIEQVRWLSREEMKAAVADKTLLLPPIMSVARKMIEAWYGPDAKAELSGGESWRP